MAIYNVSFPCVWSIEIEADSPEEAADLAEGDCPVEIDGLAFVVNKETGEEFEDV